MRLLSDRIEMSAGVASGTDVSMLGWIWRPLLAASFGIALLAGVGFAPAVMVHNAAHDGRHVLNFPCH